MIFGLTPRKMVLIPPRKKGGIRVVYSNQRITAHFDNYRYLWSQQTALSEPHYIFCACMRLRLPKCLHGNLHYVYRSFSSLHFIFVYLTARTLYPASTTYFFISRNIVQSKTSTIGESKSILKSSFDNRR